jgi:hypothetical protein
VCLYCSVLLFTWVGCAVSTISTTCGGGAAAGQLELELAVAVTVAVAGTDHLRPCSRKAADGSCPPSPSLPQLLPRRPRGAVPWQQSRQRAPAQRALTWVEAASNSSSGSRPSATSRSNTSAQLRGLFSSARARRTLCAPQQARRCWAGAGHALRW